MESLCFKCKKSDSCREPFPWDGNCKDFEQKVNASYVWKLFQGMSPTMQKSIIEIMKVTQNGCNGKD